MSASGGGGDAPAATAATSPVVVPDGKRTTESPAMKRRHIDEAWTIVKSSTLYKKSKGLRGNWLSRFWILYSSGDLVYYNDEASVGNNAKCAVAAQLQEKSVQVAHGRDNCKDCSYPGMVPDVCCLAFVTASRTYHIYSISYEDAKGWKTAIENFVPSSSAPGTPSKSPSTSSSLGESPLSLSATSVSPESHGSGKKKETGGGRIRNLNLGRRASFFTRDKSQKPVVKRTAAEAPAALDSTTQRVTDTSESTMSAAQLQQTTTAITTSATTASLVSNGASTVSVQPQNGSLMGQNTGQIHPNELPVAPTNVSASISEASLDSSSQTAVGSSASTSDMSSQPSGDLPEQTAHSRDINSQIPATDSTPANTSALASTGTPSQDSDLEEKQSRTQASTSCTGAGTASQLPSAALGPDSQPVAGTKPSASTNSVLPPPPGATGRRRSRQLTSNDEAVTGGDVLVEQQKSVRANETPVGLNHTIPESSETETSAEHVGNADPSTQSSAMQVSTPAAEQISGDVTHSPPSGSGSVQQAGHGTSPPAVADATANAWQGSVEESIVATGQHRPTPVDSVSNPAPVPEASSPLPTPGVLTEEPTPTKQAVSVIAPLLPPPSSSSSRKLRQRMSQADLTPVITNGPTNTGEDSADPTSRSGQALQLHTDIPSADTLTLQQQNVHTIASASTQEKTLPSGYSDITATSASAHEAENLEIAKPAAGVGQVSDDVPLTDTAAVQTISHASTSPNEIRLGKNHLTSGQAAMESQSSPAVPGKTPRNESAVIDALAELENFSNMLPPEATTISTAPGSLVAEQAECPSSAASHSEVATSSCSESAIAHSSTATELETEMMRELPSQPSSQAGPPLASQHESHISAQRDELSSEDATVQDPPKGLQTVLESEVEDTAKPASQENNITSGTSICTDQASTSMEASSVESSSSSDVAVTSKPPAVFESKLEQERWEMQQVEEQQARYRRMSAVERRGYEAKRIHAQQQAKLKQQELERERRKAEEEQALKAAQAEMEGVSELRRRQEEEARVRLEKIEEDRKQLASEEQEKLRKASGSERKLSVRRHRPSAEKPSQSSPQIAADTVSSSAAKLATYSITSATNDKRHKSSQEVLDKVEEERRAAEEMDRKIAERRATLSKERDEQRQAARRRKEAMQAELKQQELKALQEQQLQEEKRQNELADQMAQAARQRKLEEERIAKEREEKLEAERLLAAEHEARILNIRSNLFLEQEKARKKQLEEEQRREEEEQQKRLEAARAAEKRRDEEKAEELRRLNNRRKETQGPDASATAERQRQLEQERLQFAAVELERVQAAEELRRKREQDIAAREQERLDVEEQRRQEELKRRADEQAAEEIRWRKASENAQKAQLGQVALEEQRVQQRQREIEEECRRIQEFDKAIASQKLKENKEELKRLERERAQLLESNRAKEELERRLAEKRLADEAYRIEEARIASEKEKERVAQQSKHFLASEQRLEKEREAGNSFEERLSQFRNVLSKGKTSEEVKDDIDDLDSIARREWESRNSPLMAARRHSVRHPKKKTAVTRKVSMETESQVHLGDKVSVPTQRKSTSSLPSSTKVDLSVSSKTTALEPAPVSEKQNVAFIQEDPLRPADEGDDESSPSVHAARLMWQNRTGDSPQSSPTVRRAASPISTPRQSSASGSKPTSRSSSPHRLSPQISVTTAGDPLSPKNIMPVPSPLTRSRCHSASTAPASALSGSDAEVQAINGLTSTSSSTQCSALTSPLSPGEDSTFKFPPIQPGAPMSRIAALRNSSTRVRRNSLPTVECPKNVETARPTTPVLARVSRLASESEGESSGGEEDPSTRRQRQATKWVEKELTKLITTIKDTSSTTNSDGKSMITFQQLFDVASDIFEALSGTLLTARKHKIVVYEGDLLLQGVHNSVVITLLEDSVPDGAASGFIKQRKSSLTPDSPRRGRAFSGGSLQTTLSKCYICEKTVYPVEYVGVDDRAFHKACFRCLQCQVKLNTGNYATLDGRYYCKTHYGRLYREKGDYSLM
eukprot:scpid5620/ scgid6128/ Xin actin-binding repeat-containing protein 2; Beta-xin; Cardiomyopathy-associated protein 3; Myogenic MEF2-activated Xin-related protein; Myomaxin; mXinbeta